MIMTDYKQSYLMAVIGLTLFVAMALPVCATAASDVTSADSETEIKQCYQCTYTNATGDVSGSSHCMDRFNWHHVARVDCPGKFCIKEETTKDGYVQVHRFCVKDCEETMTVTSSSSNYVYCCKEHLCNDGDSVRRLPVSWLLLSLCAAAASAVFMQ